MKAAHSFPSLDIDAMVGTRDAVHAYARVLGDWLKACRSKRKHWWHASLRPSLTGLTTGVIHAGTSVELELDLGKSLLFARTSEGEEMVEELNGQPAAELALELETFLTVNGIDRKPVPAADRYDKQVFDAYSAECAVDIGQVLSAVSASMVEFRAGIREETSPIQLWPHHFDLSMLWLPGEKIPGQDPENEEYSDKQLNFGFTFGDSGIPEPYFYVTAYPLPDGFPGLQLPAGTQWRSDGFSGAVLLYRTLIENSDPQGYLLDLWNGLLAAGHEQMLEGTQS